MLKHDSDGREIIELQFFLSNRLETNRIRCRYRFKSNYDSRSLGLLLPEFYV